MKGKSVVQTSWIESPKTISLGCMGAEILALFKKDSVDAAQSAGKELYEK